MTGVAVPILPARDLNTSRAFYERLGFVVAGDWVSERGYLILVRGALELHLFAKPDLDPLATDTGCYVRVPDVDALHVEWSAVGVPFDPATGSRLEPPRDTPWGMRELALVDPGGNLLRVGSRPRAAGEEAPAHR